MSAMKKVKCPDCGLDMNHHADKVDYSGWSEASTDPEFGGVIQEVHSCPGCGKTETRIVS